MTDTAIAGTQRPPAEVLEAAERYRKVIADALRSTTFRDYVRIARICPGETIKVPFDERE